MIDRYFDAMDLNNTEIYIEWETPKSKNGGGIKSVSETYLKIIDDENYPGKLIFGWAISDAITKDSGTLKFAVRFVQWNDEKKLVYSFNTLTAQATVHPNLGLDLENDNYKIDNCNDRLLERIEPSEVVGGAKAAVPYFLRNIEIVEDGFDIQPNHTDGTFDLSVVATADDTGAVSYIWKRSEIGEDAWIEVPDSTETTLVELTKEEYEAFEWKLPTNRTYFLEREDDTAYLLEKRYYDLTDANTKIFFQQRQGVDIDAGEIPHIFEKRSVLRVEKYGQYKAEARNRIFNSLTKTASNIATFKKPESVEFNNENQTVDKHIIGTESAVLTPVVVESVGDLTYQWYKADEMNILSQKVLFDYLPNKTIVSYGEESVRIMCDENTEFTQQNVGPGGNKNNFYIAMKLYAPKNAVSYAQGEVGLGSEPTLGEITRIDAVADEYGVDAEGRTYRLRWIPIAYYDANADLWVYYAKGATKLGGWTYEIAWYDEHNIEIERTLMDIELANENTYSELTAFEPIIGAENTYTATEPGIYKLEVTRIRNRAEVKGESIEYRVTNAPEVPVFLPEVYDALTIVPIADLQDGSRVLSVEWDNDIKSDECYVAWYLSREEKGMEDLLIATHKVSNVFSNSFNPTDILYAPIFEAAKEDLEGLYYAVVKNKLNGVESDFNAKPEQDKMFFVTGS